MRFRLVALAVLCVLTLFTGLDRTGFLDAREARDARVARELIKNKEPIAPLYANDTWLEKPIFAYVPEVVASRLSRSAALRGTPLRSREIRALAALALLLLTGAIAARHFGRGAGAWAAIVLASTIGLPIAARADGTQVWASLFGWLGGAALLNAVVGRAPRGARGLLGGYVALAAALLVGGPLAALWPLGGIALYAWLARDRRLWSRVRPIPGFVILAGAALPWYGAMVDRVGPGFLAHALWFPYGVEAQGAWYLGPLLALSFLVIGFHPWSSLAPEAMQHAATWWRFTPRRPASGAAPGDANPALERERGEESAAHVFIAMLAAALVPVALHSGTPLTAAVPALPAAAVLCGRLIDHAFEDPARLERPIARAARMMALVGSAGALLIAMAAQSVPEAAADLRLLAAATFMTAWLPLLATWRNLPRVAVAMMTLPVAVGMPIATLYVMPGMEGYLNARAVAQTMEQQAPPEAPLALFDAPPPSLRLYAKRNLVIVAPKAAALQTLRATDGLSYIAFAPSRERDVARKLGVPLEIMARSPSLVLARVNPEHPLVASGGAP